MPKSNLRRIQTLGKGRCLALLHRAEEFVVVLRGTKLIQQEFRRFQLVHAEEQLAQDPDLGEGEVPSPSSSSRRIRRCSSWHEAYPAGIPSLPARPCRRATCAGSRPWE